MKPKQTLSKLNNLMKQLTFTAAEARQFDVHPSSLSYYVKTGDLERIGHGIYKDPHRVTHIEFQWEDLAYTVKIIPNGVVCLISALAYYQLTEEIPRLHWIAISHSTSTVKRKGVKTVRVRNMELGKTEVKIGEATLPIFDQERTIIDAFRYLSKEIAIKALKSALKPGHKPKVSLIKLKNYGLPLIPTYLR
jgi:predicted transcriptional regulator of viral defense system